MNVKRQSTVVRDAVLLPKAGYIAKNVQKGAKQDIRREKNLGYAQDAANSQDRVKQCVPYALAARVKG